MILKIFTVHDTKAKTYLRPFFCQEIGQATRSFHDLINDNTHPMGQHPHDYTLFYIGTYDDQKGVVQSNNIESLGNGIEFLKVPEDITELTYNNNGQFDQVKLGGTD